MTHITKSKTLSRLKALTTWLGINQAPASHSEKMLSGAGGMLAILVILIVSEAYLGLPESTAIVVSMGASSVLVFAIPHSPLSQPWSLFGGHLVSALVGVICAQWINDPIFAAASAVGLAIAGMYYLKCLHPPGGATALTAVLGGEAIHELGYQFLVTPVLLNLLIILVTAIVFNRLFHWRRYPAYQPPAPFSSTAEPPPFSTEELLKALKEIDTFVDINEYELKRIFGLIDLSGQAARLPPEAIEVGGFYSNGHPGADWEVRQVIALTPAKRPEKARLTYTQIKGRQASPLKETSLKAFSEWARYPVTQAQGCWQRLD